MKYYPNIGISIYIIGSIAAIVLRVTGIVSEGIAVLLAVLALMIPMFWCTIGEIPEDDNDETF